MNSYSSHFLLLRPHLKVWNRSSQSLKSGSQSLKSAFPNVWRGGLFNVWTGGSSQSLKSGNYKVWSSAYFRVWSLLELNLFRLRSLVVYLLESLKSSWKVWSLLEKTTLFGSRLLFFAFLFGVSSPKRKRLKIDLLLLGSSSVWRKKSLNAYCLSW